MASGVQITGLIKPLNSGSFPVWEDIDGLGGFRVVADTTARDAIPANYRKIGMVVSTAAGASYQLIGGLLNANWTAYAAGGVTSVFGRGGVVVAAASDYAASQVTNDSGVVGAFVANALNTLSAAIAALAIATTAPLTGGGTVASGLTFAVNDVSNASKGVVPAITAGSSTLTSNVGGTSSSWVALSGGGSPVGTSRTIATTAPISGGGDLSANRTLAIAAFDVTGAYVTSGPANTFLKGTGAGNSWATLQTQPASPGDNGKVFVASSGDASFVGGSTTGQLLIWNNAAPVWAAGTDIGAQTITTSGGFSMSGTNVPVTGNLRMGNTTTAKFTTSGGATFNIFDCGVTNADNITYGDSGRGVFILCASGNAISLTMGSTNNKWFGTQLQMSTPNIQWSTSASPLLNVQTDTTATNTTGKTFAINGQNLTGTNTTGGPVRITSGSGSVTVGELSLEVNNNATKLIRLNGTGLAFFGAAPVAQPARVGQLTDSTTGTPGATISDGGAVYSQATTNNNNASLLAKINGLESIIHTLALSA